MKTLKSSSPVLQEINDKEEGDEEDEEEKEIAEKN